MDLNQLEEDEKNIYELVTRHFLASCGKDAQGIFLFHTLFTVII